MYIKLKAIIIFICFFLVITFLLIVLFSFILNSLYIYIHCEISLYGNLLSVLILIIAFLISLLISRKFYKDDLKNLNLDDVQFNKTIEPLLKNKNEIMIDEIFQIYGSERVKNKKFKKMLYKRIYSWIAKYNFVVQGDKIILNPDKIPMLIDELDAIYRKWNVKDKTKKI